MSQELIQTIAFGVALALIVGAWLYSTYKQGLAKKKKLEAIEITYDQAIDIGKGFLISEAKMKGERGIWKPYAQNPDYNYKGSIDTLSKAFSHTSEYKNIPVVMQVLENYAPGKYKLVEDLEKQAS